jgi:hypothetical protein
MENKPCKGLNIEQGMDLCVLSWKVVEEGCGILFYGRNSLNRSRLIYWDLIYGFSCAHYNGEKGNQTSVLNLSINRRR